MYRIKWRCPISWLSLVWLPHSDFWNKPAATNVTPRQTALPSSTNRMSWLSIRLIKSAHRFVTNYLLHSVTEEQWTQFAGWCKWKRKHPPTVDFCYPDLELWPRTSTSSHQVRKGPLCPRQTCNTEAKGCSNPLDKRLSRGYAFYIGNLSVSL